MFILRDYQKECVGILDAVESGSHMAVLATGLGKSVIFSSLKRRGRTLILSHRDELVRQPARYYDCPFGIEKGEEHSAGEEIVSASVQTLYRPNRLTAFSPDAFDTIIVDEAHHMARGNVTYRNILSYFRPRRILGFTATPRRGDGVRLDDVFEDIVFARDTRWGIEHGWLAPIRAVRVMTKADISRVRNTAGDLNENDLEEALVSSDAVMRTAHTYVAKCHQTGRQTLLYTVTVRMCQLVLEAIHSLLPTEEWDTVQVITGKTPLEERQAILSAYGKRQVRCIINCMVLTEGFDAPATDAIVIMRPTCSEPLYQQIVGRGLRLSEGKKDCLVVDIAGRDGDGRRICSAPSLFGIDMRYATAAQRKQMEEEYDLLEKVDAVRGFLEERERRLTDIGRMKKAFTFFAAEQLENILEEKGEDRPPELAPFHVLPGPSEEKRYGIDFRSGMLYLSEPDVLNRTCVRVEKEGKVYLKEMPLQEAADFAEKLVHVFRAPDYLWNAEVRKKWRKEPATSLQTARIAKHHSLDQEIRKGISKAQACEIIELDTRMEALRNEMKARGIFYTLNGSEGDARRKAAEIACEKYLQEKAEAEKMGKEQFDLFERYVEDRYRKLPSEKSLGGSPVSLKGSETFTFPSPNEAVYHADIALKRKCPPGRSATTKQKALIGELEETLRSKGIVIEGSLFVAGMEQANRLITVLMQIKRETMPLEERAPAWCVQAEELKTFGMKLRDGRIRGEVHFRKKD